MGDDIIEEESLSIFLNKKSELYAIAILTHLGWRYTKSMKNGFGTVKAGVHHVTRELSEALLYSPTDKKYDTDLSAIQSQNFKCVKTISINATYSL
jgi:hypothetical protein